MLCEALNQRCTGGAEKTVAVTETHLVVYKKMPGFIKGLETEAALVVEFEIFRDPDNGKA